MIYWNGNRWPAFNVADSAISIGVAILLIRMLFFGNRVKEGSVPEEQVSESKAVITQI